MQWPTEQLSFIAEIETRKQNSCEATLTCAMTKQAAISDKVFNLLLCGPLHYCSAKKGNSAKHISSISGMAKQRSPLFSGTAGMTRVFKLGAIVGLHETFLKFLGTPVGSHPEYCPLGEIHFFCTRG